MSDNEGLSQYEVSLMIAEQLKPLEKALKILETQASNSFQKAKDVENIYRNKVASDLTDLKTFRKDQDIEHKKVSSKFSEVLTMLHDILNNFASTTKDVEEIKKRTAEDIQMIKNHSNNLSARFWVMVSAIMLFCLLTVATNYKLTLDDVKTQNINQERLEVKLNKLITELKAKGAQ